jgi:hypothetical protein
MITHEKVCPYFLKHKSDVVHAFKKWKVMVQKKTEKKVKFLRTENGKKFCYTILMIVSTMKTLSGTTSSHVFLNKMVSLSVQT